MTAVMRWRVKHSVKHPGRWVVYQLYGDQITLSSDIAFHTWDSAMSYANSRIRWWQR